jgi:hypothetical protein
MIASAPLIVAAQKGSLLSRHGRQLCAAAERLLARHGGLDDDGAVAAAVEAAIAGCTASAAACGAHAEHHAHCAAHSRAATRCAETLTALRA